MTEQLRKAGLHSASEMGVSKRLGKIRLLWRDGTVKDIAPVLAERMGAALEDSAEREAGWGTVFGEISIERVDGAYYGQAARLVRFHWGDGTWLDLHPNTVAAYAAMLRMYVAELRAVKTR